MMASNRKQQRIAFVLVLVALVALSNFFSGQVRDFWYGLAFSIQKPLQRARGTVARIFFGIRRAEQLQQYNAELLLENQTLLSGLVRLQAIEDENKMLRQALDIGIEKEFKLILVRVSIPGTQEDILIIDKGIRDGVGLGMPVVSGEKVLYGFVSQTFERSSQVRLLSHEESSFNVRIAESNITGVVRGSKGNGALLGFIPRGQKLQEGQLIITRSLAAGYPEGLLVGFIDKLQASDIEPFQQAVLLLLSDSDKTDKLFVVTDF